LKSDNIIKYGGYHPNFNEEIKYFKKRKIYSVQIESNLACQQGCYYCYASTNSMTLRELPKRDIISVLNSIAKMNVKSVDWLGGDPLIRKDWFDLMEYAIEKGISNNVWTSGIPLNDLEIARKVVKATEGGFISVHLDTLNENLYKKLHAGNPKEKIKAILKGVDNVQKLGKKPEQMINCITFTKLISKDVKNTMKYFFEKKGMRTCLTQMCLEGFAKKHLNWIPDLKEIKQACEARDKINYPESDVSMGPMDANKFYCGGIICVTIDGDVTPCSVIRKSFGNIHDLPLEKIIDQYKKELLFMHLRNHKNLPSKCSSCKNNSICWGCRAAAYYSSGDICGIDPNCYKNNHYYGI
jgi:radical SAM protein with 4Fe4S-binding SPASM domain